MKNETYFYNMIFKGGTIRVVSPVTEDGNRPKIDPETDRPIYREDFFPITAKKGFEDQNAKLPPHLKKKIEILNDGDVRQPAEADSGKSLGEEANTQDAKVADLVRDNEELKARLAELEAAPKDLLENANSGSDVVAEPVERKKPGPKPKEHAQSN